MDAEQLEKMMGFAPGELEKATEAYEKDEWPKGRTVKLGRPPISDEPSAVLSARVGESVLEAFDEKAKRHGQTRTERLRELITLDAMIAQAPLPRRPNMYVSIQSRHFSTSLDVGVQFLYGFGTGSRWGGS